MPRKNPWASLFLTGVLLAAFSLFAGAARGNEDADFRRHYERALKLYDSGKYQESAKEFQAAYAIKQLPKLLLNLGQVHRRLGHAKEALAYYEFYLRVEPNPEPKLKLELDRYIAQTRAMLESAPSRRRARARSGKTRRRHPRHRPSPW